MITKDKLDEWRKNADHWNIRDNPAKLKQMLLEAFEVIDGAINESNKTTIRAPKKVSRNSKNKS